MDIAKIDDDRTHHLALQPVEIKRPKQLSFSCDDQSSGAGGSKPAAPKEMAGRHRQ